jgi:hypothetical protein
MHRYDNYTSSLENGFRENKKWKLFTTKATKKKTEESTSLQESLCNTGHIPLSAHSSNLCAFATLREKDPENGRRQVVE